MFHTRRIIFTQLSFSFKSFSVKAISGICIFILLQSIPAFPAVSAFHNNEYSVSGSSDLMSSISSDEIALSDGEDLKSVKDPADDPESQGAEADDSFWHSIDGNSKPKNFWIASAELGAALIIGNIIYYINGETNRQDYLYSKDETAEKRFTSTDTLAFDTNPIPTNAISHSLAGTVYYLIPRSNGFNSAESLAFAFTASVVWEYICEFREVTSINDLIMTPLGGMTLGENIFQFAALFAAEDSSGFFSDFLNNWMFSGANHYQGALVKDGFSRSVWHDMKFSAGGGSGENDSFANLELDLEMYGIRGFNRSGKKSGMYYNGPYVRMLVNSKIESDRIKDFQFYTEMSLLSYVNQNLTSGKESTGHTFSLGINSAFEYKFFKTTDYEDQLGIAHIAGPAADLFLKVQSAVIRTRIALFGDFSCVQSYGLDPYLKDGHTNEELEERGAYVTAEQGYYYAYGTTTDASVSIEWAGFETGGRIIYSQFNYMDVPQDDYPKSDNPMTMGDKRTEIKAWLLYNFPETSMAFKIDYNRKSLEGYADQYSRSTAENFYYGSFVFGIM